MSIEKPQTVTLIDVLSEGYRAVNRRPWLLLVPIMLNAYLWFGTQLSFEPLVYELNTMLQAMERLQGTQATTPELQSQYGQEILAFGQLDMRQPLALFNAVPLTIYVLGLVGNGLGVPMVQAAPQLLDGRRAVIEVGSLAGALLAFLLVNILLLPLSAAFLAVVAEIVRGDPMPWRTWIRRIGRATLHIIGYVGLVVGLVLVIGVPAGFFVGLLLQLIPALGALLLVMLIVFWFWFSVYLGFTPEAMVMSGIGPIQGLRASFTIVRRSFWSTLLFLILLCVITIGSGVIWQSLIRSALGLVIAIIGSAYIGSGLVAARMAFYREQLQRWQAAAGATRRA